MHTNAPLETGMHVETSKHVTIYGAGWVVQVTLLGSVKASPHVFSRAAAKRIQRDFRGCISKYSLRFRKLESSAKSRNIYRLLHPPEHWDTFGFVI